MANGIYERAAGHAARGLEFGLDGLIREAALDGEAEALVEVEASAKVLEEAAFRATSLSTVSMVAAE